MFGSHTETILGTRWCLKGGCEVHNLCAHLLWDGQARRTHKNGGSFPPSLWAQDGIFMPLSISNQRDSSIPLLSICLSIPSFCH